MRKCEVRLGQLLRKTGADPPLAFFMAGGYATHGETYRKEGNSRDIFWTYGGDLVGESASRIRFLREIAESMPLSAWSRT